MGATTRSGSSTSARAPWRRSCWAWRSCPSEGVTHASNFTFVFLVVTIVAAEFGGRGPGRRDRPGLGPEPRLLPHRALPELASRPRTTSSRSSAWRSCGLVAAALGLSVGERTRELRKGSAGAPGSSPSRDLASSDRRRPLRAQLGEGPARRARLRFPSPPPSCGTPSGARRGASFDLAQRAHRAPPRPCRPVLGPDTLLPDGGARIALASGGRSRWLPRRVG